MVYCSNCGKEMSDDANFCFKCGTKTAKGKTENVAYPVDELKEALERAGVELEKAFIIAARETKAAIKKVKENMQESKTTNSEKIKNNLACPHCKAENVQNAVFCYNCGKKIELKDKTNLNE